MSFRESSASRRSGGVVARPRRLARFSTALPIVALGIVAACNDSSSGGGRRGRGSEVAMVERWNQITCDASGFDHQNAQTAEQLGPCRASRAMAIVHIAMFEVVNAIKGDYASYIGLPAAQSGTSMKAAIAQACHDTLVALYPNQTATFDTALAEDLGGGGSSEARGITLGQDAANAILTMRAADGSNHPEPMYVAPGGVPGPGLYVASDQPGKWRQDPISMIPIALGADWDQVTPFVMTTADQFRAPVPPALTSPEYALAFDEVKVLGGDGNTTPTARNAEGTEIGIYWAYDGVPNLCAPPRLYNQITVQLAEEQNVNDVVELARLLALINVAQADVGLAIWESKYFYEVWRPVTGIRESDPGTGPTGLGDGNASTVGDPTFSPLGAPASNLVAGVNFTPPFPAYPSGHAGFGGAIFQVLRRFFGTDNIDFTFVSDEFNGITLDNTGIARPLLPRTFPNLSVPEEENGQSRIYLGIHWMFDKTGGIAQGNSVGDFVFDNLYVPVP